jgi:ZIP family zinc transporter
MTDGTGLPSLAADHAAYASTSDAGSTDWQTPILLSTIAGMSTALGAAIVFVLPKSKKENVGNGNSTTFTREVSPNVMCFSLSLAGSVMVTISLISLLPEVFLSHDNITCMQYSTRIASIALGCGLYKVLSWSFPEPEEILHQQANAAAEKPNDSPAQVLAVRENVHQQHDIEMSSSKSYDRHGAASTGKSKNQSFNPRRRPLSPQSSSLMDDDEQRPLVFGGSSYDHGNDQGSNFASSRVSERNIVPTASTSSWTFRGNDLADAEQRKSWRVAMLLFVALLAHNFPEGLAVAASATQSKSLGMTVTVGIMIHNIPEGIAIAIPCLRARPQSPWLAFILASGSGLAEPLGAAVTVLFLQWMEVTSTIQSVPLSMSPIDQWAWRGISLEDVLAFVAGVMTTVAICELFPEARRHMRRDDKGKSEPSSSQGGELATPSSYYGGILSGFVTMVATEWYLQ